MRVFVAPLPFQLMRSGENSERIPPHGACRTFRPAGPGEDPPMVPRIEVDEKTRFGPGLHPEDKGGFTGYPVTALPVDVPA